MSELTEAPMQGKNEDTLSFDPDALREKYRIERDKRLRADGIEQYIEVKGDFSHYVDDPYTEWTPRPEVKEDVEALIIGGGFGGLLAAVQLLNAGVSNFRIIEKGGDFGGTWYWNRYPGAQCDVESYIYMPLLEETGYVPKEKYAYQPEIFAHAQRIGRHFDLYDKTLFQTRIADLRWSAQECVWVAKTDRGDLLTARFVITCSGGQDRPRLPGIPGIDSFKGHTFHTSRWDYSYTGGDTTGNLDKLHDKKVAVIGTGATGVQCIPFIGRCAQHLYVFQRTPAVVGERGNKPTDPTWVASLTPGWQGRRMENYTSLVLGGHEEVDLVDDGWTHATSEMASVYGTSRTGDFSEEEQKLRAEIADFKVMNKIRARVDKIVRDRQAAEALKPWYRFFCKRPTFNDEFLPAFNRPNVTLVDTNGRGVERITERGLVVGGVEYEVDCIVFATGFEVGTDYTRRAGFEIHGRDGRTHTEHWKDGARTLHGLMSSGFPNFFFMGTIQVGFTINYHEMMLKQSTHIAEVIAWARKRNAAFVEPTREAEDAWVDLIVQGNETKYEFMMECTPSYFNNEGRPTPHGKGLADAQFTEGLIAWNKILEQWRANGKLEGLVIG